MKIAVIEIECHAEVLKSTLLLFSRLPNYTLSVFTTISILEETGLSEEQLPTITFYFPTKDQSETDFIKDKIEFINQHNHLLFNTLQRKFRFYNALGITIPYSLRIHNVNFYWSSVFKRKSYRLSDFRLIIKEFYGFEFIHRKLFIAKATHYLFPSKNSLEYATASYPINTKKTAILPFSFRLDYPKATTDNRSKMIVIPGKLETKRKDFELIYSFAKQLVSIFNDELELVFLGESATIESTILLEKLRGLSTDKLKITYFNTLVDPITYEAYFRKTDLVFCPMVVDTVFNLSKEKYGQSKVSGGVNDAIHYGKPFIISKEYPIDEAIVNECITFESIPDLVEKVTNYLLQPRKIELNSNTIYTIENQLNQIQKLFK
jgi:hypothetical protein